MVGNQASVYNKASGRDIKQERQEEFSGKNPEKGAISKTKVEESAFAKSSRLHRSPPMDRKSLEMQMQTTIQEETIQIDLESPSWDATTDPFKRRTMIDETTGECAGMMSEHVEELQESKSDKEGISQAWQIKTSNKKRKCTNSPIETSQVKCELSDTIKKLGNKTKKMMDFVEKNKNVHKELKEAIMELSSLTRRISNEYISDKNKHEELIEEYSKYKHQDEIRIEQAIREAIVKENLNQREFQICKIRKNGEECVDITQIEKLNYLSFAEIQDKQWTDNSYQCTKMDTEDPLKNTNDKIIFMDVQDNRRSKTVINKYSELEEAEKIECNGGAFSYLDQSITYRTKDTTETRTKCVIAVYHDPTKQDASTMAEGAPAGGPATPITPTNPSQEENFFKRQLRLLRSPPYSPNVSVSMPSLSDSTIDLTDIDKEVAPVNIAAAHDEGHYKKRRLETPPKRCYVPL
ncbi:hypothetical protein FQR65_LT15968 [Abscondita terminalis]|nr:hypothetical protein FQR65_LT15968 [Abscondita terminalis]